MNIALSAVLIFILLLSPIAFYISFSFGRFPKASPKIGILEGLVLSAIFSVILHSIALLFIHREIRFDILALLIGGDLKTFGTVASNDTFKTQFQEFVLYNGILIAFALLVGRILRILLVHKRWHTQSELLRLYNNWWYLFQGFKLDGFINQKNPPEFDIVFADVLVNTNAGTMIYSGYLIDYVCQGETLDRIYLSETQKREFKQTRMNDKGNYLYNQPSEPVAIEGDTMSIPYSNIININLHFLKLPVEFELINENSKIEIVRNVFQIFKDPQSYQYLFKLKSPNGATLLTSEMYLTKVSSLSAIESLTRNASYDERYERLSDHANYRFRVKAANGEIIAFSETYTTLLAMEMAIDMIKKGASEAVVEDLS